MWSILINVGLSALSLISPLSGITKQIEQAIVQRNDAKTEQEKIAADERIKTLQQQKEIILQAQSDPFERWIRIGFALPFVIFIWKTVVYDKVLALGVTDNLSENLWVILWIVLGGYFLDTTVKRFKK